MSTHFMQMGEKKAHRLTAPNSSGRPKTWAEKTPKQMKMLGTRPRNPRRFLGAISPRYMGTTLRQIPDKEEKSKKGWLANGMKRKKQFHGNKMVLLNLPTSEICKH